jgi:alginate O-acetyltransferase complex protein AlgI
MLFNSPEFIFFFLPATLLGCYALAHFRLQRGAIAWLLACSMFFYAWFKPVYLILLIGSMLANYFIGNRIIETRERRPGPARSWLVAGLVLNLGVLAYFKYFNFFVDTVTAVTGAGWQVSDILLPLGISFFTFQKIAYLMDCHAGVAHRTQLLKYMLFVMFFPQLIAGPIVHPNDILPQLDKKDVLRFRMQQFLEGFAIFFLGLAKKVVLADQFGVWASEGFDATAGEAHLSFLEAWAAALSYTLQIYFDFSGYTDMAIGMAWMFGIRLPVNFRSPYQAASIIDFWRRWHITLSNFLRDYLYIPLGGNRKGQMRRWVNLVVVMLLGGLWHGAGWTFVVWGLLHGVYLVLNHGWHAIRRRVPVLQRSFGWPGHFLAWGVTMLSVVVAWVFFRAPDLATAWSVLRGMAGLNGIAVSGKLGKLEVIFGSWIQTVPRIPHLARGYVSEQIELAFFLALGWLIVLFAPRLEQCSVRTRYLLLIPCFALALQKVLVSVKPSEFLYFQF